MITRIDILNFRTDPPERLTSWWWSDERGLTCDNPRAVDLLADEGIVLPGGERTVYPRDGREFFDALPVRYSGMLRAQDPEQVEEQGGEPV